MIIVQVSVLFVGQHQHLNLEYTLPEVSQSVIITRMAGRTPVPEKESIESFAAHQATMVVFLSTGLLEELSRTSHRRVDIPTPIHRRLLYTKRPGKMRNLLSVRLVHLAQTAERKSVLPKTALMIIGETVAHSNYERSKLYDPGFTTEFRKGTDAE